MKTLLNDTGPNGDSPVLPSSDMTICGNTTNPIMLISANHQWRKEGKWVLAVKLQYNDNISNNTLLWKIPLNETILSKMNYANGDYTILTENNQSRILFGTWLGGVMAIGTFPNTWFQNIEYSLKDSSNDVNTFNDTVQVNYTIKSAIPDRVLVKVMLISEDYPILCRYSAPEKHYNATPVGLEDSINLSLPSYAPAGNYSLEVFLYNSSGEKKDVDYNPLNLVILNKKYANETYEPDPFPLFPTNDPPEKPQQPWVADVIDNRTKTFATYTTDPNDDNIWYQWRWNTSLGITLYSRWIVGGPYPSGENCYRTIGWLFPGDYQVQVRAKDDIFQPNVFSDWSEPLDVTVTSSQGETEPWGNELLGQFTQTLVTPAQQTSCNGFAEGVYVDIRTKASLSWNWSFGDGTYSEEQNVAHNYSQKGIYMVNLSLENGEGDFYNCTVNVSVVILKSDFRITGGQPETNISFTDASSGSYTIMNWSWDFGDGNTSYQQDPIHVYTTPGVYSVSLTVKDDQDDTHVSNQTLQVESLKPQYVSVLDYPDPVGTGQNVTIGVDLFENQSGINAVYLNITSPDNETTGNILMETNMSYPYDYVYVFNDTWQTGVYTYSVSLVDHANNTNYTTGYTFTVSAQAAINLSTVKNNYSGTEYINLTDPPGDPLPSLGYELLDNGTVLHLWNQYDSYYFNTSSGIQLTNHYNKYWSENVLMLGYYNNDQWNLLYRTDELTGFNKNIQTDNATFVNITLWKDLAYNGYQFRLALRYHLGAYDTDLTVIPSMKNTGTSNIPYVLGFGWELKNIQINMTTTGDYIQIDHNMFLLNQTLNLSYTSLEDPMFTVMENLSDSQSMSLYLRWDPDLTYKVQVKSRPGQENTPVTLFIRVGTLAAGQQKYTLLHWFDARQKTFTFTAYDENEAWEDNPDAMVDENEQTFASTRTGQDIELCNESNYNGEDQGTILKVELRVNGYYEGKLQKDIILRPVFKNGHGENYNFSVTDQPEWSSWFDITNDQGRGSLSQWTWPEVEDLDCDVQAPQSLEGTTLYCSKIELRVTSNNAPVISNPSPSYGVYGVTLQPWLNITVSDPDGDLMNVTWYSNSTSSWLTLRPNANGSTTQLERYPMSQNANYKCVDETIANDSDYVKWKGSSWKKDTYNLPNHSNQSGTIHDVTVYARCARVGSITFPTTTSSAKIVIRSGGNYYYGSEFKPPYSPMPPISYTNYAYTWKNNPSTGNAWSWTDIDNLQAGITFIGNEGTSECTQLYIVVNYTNPSTWLQFGRNSSVGNGTYRQRFLNASVNGQWWYWKVKADDGTLSTWSSVYKFYTGYQSKIENSGGTNISGYLLMQVQFYNTSQGKWLVDKDTINETTSRTINSGNQLALDTIFNGHVRASNLIYGAGTYRVYAAFRGPEGNILKTNSGAELKAWWQFSKT